MVCRRSLMLLAMVFLVAHADSHAQTEWVGIVEPAGFGVCMAESHWIFDPCKLENRLVKSSTLDLDESLCRYVRIEGPVQSDGWGCDIMDVQDIEIVVPVCRNEVLPLRVRRPPGDPTVLEWWETLRSSPCLEGYDVIRGTLPVGPPSGQAFFYLVRINGAPDFQTYGVSSSNAERMPLSGDCVRSH
jgi:hypothetical protein